MMMILRFLLCGLGIWAVPFLLGMALFPFVPPETELFETAMSVAMSFAVSLFSWLHLSRLARPGWQSGLLCGFGWAGIAIALDLPYLPMMQMDADQYVRDIALTYLMIPMIAAFIGLALRRTG